MYKAIFYILIFGIIFSSCKNENEKLIGHWHEFNIGESEFLNCFIITDSTFSEDKYSIGGTNRLTDIEDYKSPLDWVFYPDKLKSKIKFKKNEIQFGDSIIWKRQKNDLKTFISDFSAGLKLDVKPYETDSITFDLQREYEKTIYLYIGKVKESFTGIRGVENDRYYVQLNDKISTSDNIFQFVMCYDCDRGKYKILISADKYTPNDFLKEVEAEITKNGYYRRSQIYYLVINPKEQISGYNHYH